MIKLVGSGPSLPYDSSRTVIGLNLDGSRHRPDPAMADGQLLTVSAFCRDPHHRFRRRRVIARSGDAAALTDPAMLANGS